MKGFGKLKMFLAFAFVLTAFVPAVRAGQNYPEPCTYKDATGSKASPLCGGLIEYWGFEEASDSPRFGAFGTALLEVNGKNTANIAEIVSIEGTKSLDLESTDQAWLWQLGGLPTGSSTIAVWFKLESLSSTVGTKQTIVSSNTANIAGPELYVETTNATSPKAKVCYTNYEAETSNQLTVCSAADSLLVATAYHVAAGESPFFVGKSRLFLSLDGAAMTTTAAAYYTVSGIPLTDVGAHRSSYLGGTFSQYFDGQLEQLIEWRRPLTQAEINLLVVAGTKSPRSYPFATE